MESCELLNENVTPKTDGTWRRTK